MGFDGPDPPTDLVVLAPGKDEEASLHGLLNRPQHLRIRRIGYELVVDSKHDSNVFRRCHEILRLYQRRASHALVVFDRDGCGGRDSREALEADVERRLAQNGWQERSAAVVIDPELEAWVWSDSPQVGAVLGWSSQSPGMSHWLVEQGYLIPGQVKPDQPKEALYAVLRKTHKGRSSAIYRELADRVSFERCADAAFRKLRETLQRWFPAT
jgi:hypothetical protein